MSITCVGLADNQYLVQSHIGQIIFSSTLDTEDKVKQLYGGNKWVKIEGKFLLGASDKYANGDVGGEETHVLTINESPSHTALTMCFGLLSIRLQELSTVLFQQEMALLWAVTVALNTMM